MENIPRLYDTLVHVLRQQATWLDQRHLKTLAWMMVGLIQAGDTGGELSGMARTLRFVVAEPDTKMRVLRIRHQYQRVGSA